MTRFLLAVTVLLALAGCTPWYREDALLGSGRRACGESVSRGDAALQKLEWEAAEREYERAIAGSPRCTSAHVGLARVYLRQNRTASAIATARWARDHGEPGAIDRIASEWAGLGLDPLVVELLSPKSASELGQRKESQAYAQLVEAHALRSQGRTRESLAAYGRFLEAYGELDHPLLRSWSDDIRRQSEQTALRLVETARTHARTGDPSRALHAWTLALRVGPSELSRTTRDEFAALARKTRPRSTAAEAEAESAARATEEGRRGKALGAWRRAVAFAPWWPEARKGLALALADIGLDAEARLQRDWYLALAREGDPDVPVLRAWEP